MALPDYPIPKLETTLQEVDRVLKLTLGTRDYDSYQQRLQAALPTIEANQTVFKPAVQGYDNWATDGFKKHLLSLRDPLPLTTSVAAILQPSQRHEDQLEYAAVLLWTMGQLESEMIGAAATSTSRLETTQQSELFGATRVPEKVTDRLDVYPKSRHAIVLHRDSAFPVMVRNDLDEPLTTDQLLEQLRGVVAYDGERHHGLSHFTARPRQEWARVRAAYSRSAPEALRTLESAVAVLVLEDGELDASDEGVSAAMSRVKTERMRHYDKVLNVVVYRNCVAAVLVEHAAVDGLVAVIVMQQMHAIAEQQASPRVTNDSRVPVRPLDFGEVEPPSDGNRVLAASDVVTLDFAAFPDVLSTLREQRLYDPWIHLSLQMAVEATCADVASGFLHVAPTHVRHFKRGRSDPTYTVTDESRRLARALLGEDADERRLLEMAAHAVTRHIQLVQATKTGCGVGPHLGYLRKLLNLTHPELATYLERFGAPSICVTGSSSLERLACGIGNLYADPQIIVSYMGRKGGCRVAMTASGTFRDHVPALRKNMQRALGVVFRLVCQLGVLKQMNIERPLAPPSPHKSGEKAKQFAIAIHGGAAEHVNLGEDALEIVRFALYAALMVGVQLLATGGSSLDAVEAAVGAMENCPVFNAGKGAVYNADGKHELDACIVDGASGSAGCVGCVTSVRNPVQGARKVMEQSGHVFLAGAAADEFCRERGLAVVDNRHFDTDIRHQQFLKSAGSTEHEPQTVGAVAVDVRGHLAAASSTGGVVRKMKGRVSDTAVVGAGTYADAHVAVSCTGDGEAFLRKAVAARVAVTRALRGWLPLERVCQQILDADLSEHVGGIVAVDDRLHVATVSNAPMFSASYRDGRIQVQVGAASEPQQKQGDSTLNGYSDKSAPLVRPPRSWSDPRQHSRAALTDRWYSNLFRVQDTLYHATVDYFRSLCGYSFALTPITTDTISSPMGLGSDSEPVQVDLLGQPTFLADSMQFALEYFLRLNDACPGTYYVAPSFRGEEPDAEHLNQFYHVECELRGDLDAAISVAERYVKHLTERMLEEHRELLLETAGTVRHLEEVLRVLSNGVPRITLDDAVRLLGDAGSFHEPVAVGRPEFGVKLTRKGERALMARHGGPVWLTEMDHLSVPFYQAYVDGTHRTKAKAADLLLGMGETLGLGERHKTADQVTEALTHHGVPEASYEWYVDMRRVKPLLTSGWGMGTERYVCWLLQHDDVRDVQVVPRMKGMKFLP